MSADYDRLFNNSSSGQADNEEATRTVDHATLAAAARVLGISKNSATGRFDRIRKGYGEQGR